VQGIMIEPDMPRGLLGSIDQSVWEALVANGISYMTSTDRKGHGGATSHSKNGKTVASGIDISKSLLEELDSKEKDFPGNKARRINHVVAHELAHKIWSEDLTDAQKQIVENAAKDSEYAQRLKRGEVTSGAGITEENFCENFAWDLTKKATGVSENTVQAELQELMNGLNTTANTQQTNEVEEQSTSEEKLKSAYLKKAKLENDLEEALIELEKITGNKLTVKEISKIKDIPYAQALEAVQQVLQSIPQGDLTVDQVEQLLTDLEIEPNLMAEFFKLKENLIATKVKIKTCLSGCTEVGTIAEFQLETNTVNISLNNILTDPSIQTAQDIGYIFMHELIHAAVAYKVNTYVTPEMTGDFKSLTFQAGLQAPLTQIEREAIEDLRFVLKQLSEKTEFQEEYGIKNINEMLAELSNKDFAQKLKDTTVETKEGLRSLWNIIFDAITKLLGTVQKSDNAYARVYKAYETLLEIPSIKQSEVLQNMYQNLYGAYTRKTELTTETEALLERKSNFDKWSTLKFPSSKESKELNNLISRIDSIKKELKNVNIEISNLEKVYNPKEPIIPESLTSITPDMLDTLELELNYSRTDIREMTPDEAMDIITSGLTKEAADQQIEDGIADAQRKEASERHDIRREFTKMLEKAETLEDISDVKARAHEILSKPGLVSISGYNAKEISSMIEQRKQELREHINFDALSRGDQIYMYDNLNSKFVVIGKTANTVKLRKFGDILGPVFSVSRSKAQEKIKYMSNEFLDEGVLTALEVTPEEESFIKEGIKNATELSDAVTIKEDVTNAKSKSDEDLKNDLRNELDQNCE
tara:strand:- start:327 stop:2774 length:2448 start_codon:yes stop_codon:yes gene_type:complete